MTPFLNIDGRQRDLFRKEIHYQWAMYGLGFGIAFSLFYLIPRSFATSTLAVSFVNDVAKIVPFMRFIREYAPPYTPFWGLYYAAIWCVAPFSFVLGYVGTFFLNESDYKRIIVDEANISNIRLIVLVLVFIACEVVQFYLPIINIYLLEPAGQSATFRQMFYTFMLIGGPFINGRLIGVIWIRRQRKRKHD